MSVKGEVCMKVDTGVFDRIQEGEPEKESAVGMDHCLIVLSSPQEKSVSAKGVMVSPRTKPLCAVACNVVVFDMRSQMRTSVLRGGNGLG